MDEFLGVENLKSQLIRERRTDILQRPPLFPAYPLQRLLKPMIGSL